MDGNGSLYGTLQGNNREVLHKFSVDLVNRIGMVVERALPLWSRMSERGNARGERHYSEAFGQPMEHFFVPGQLTANLSSLAQAARGCTGTAALKGSRRAACAASVGQ